MADLIPILLTVYERDVTGLLTDLAQQTDRDFVLMVSVNTPDDNLGAFRRILDYQRLGCWSPRYAILIGANAGDRNEVELRYAEKDAERMADILRSIGGFGPENISVLEQPTRETVERVLRAGNTRLRSERGPSLLLVFYSGHADAGDTYSHRCK